jgi:hypothetical protein
MKGSHSPVSLPRALEVMLHRTTPTSQNIREGGRIVIPAMVPDPKMET